ncbi:hypothetical protein [Mesorhizobium sp.]|uniref:hypothetical protein n=1 Tax=Mesorhizobium sp. TaxID=1871066 RepID=UPI000FE99A28|nr:hypothetical protein [Mesorhizobium sp.]RWI35467.1 MAG: hypothetical protein EOR14_28610 [Mesorhizobium sp.]RWJ66364.1 MAG: hypothetical protein EOR34_28525 [Mesorhizobium sp.]
MALNPALQKLISNASNKYSRSSGNRIKPKEGVNRYRILAPTPAQAAWVKPDLQFWADCGVHWIKADENGKPLAVVGCESTVNQAPCPVCTAIDQAVASAIDEDSKKLYESWKVKLTVLVNVLDRSKGSSNPDDVQILELTPTTWGKVMSVIQQYGEEGEDILDLANGMDLSITRTGKGLNTEYSVNVAAGKSAPVKPEQIKGTHDLYAHIQKEFFRGDEPKALAAIAQISGVSMPRLTSAGGARTPTRALTSQAASVADSDVQEEAALEALEEEAVVEEEAPAPAKTVATKPVVKAPATAPVEEEMDDILADLENI